MILIDIVLVCVSAVLVQNTVADPPKFRILAPPFFCPKDKDSVIDKPNNTIIILQTEPGIPVEFNWVVRWDPLDAPTQRSTLSLWENVRELEAVLNGDQLENDVFIIGNNEFLTGVKYIFNVTASTYNDDVRVEKSFEIDNVIGDPKLLIEGKSDRFYVVIIGAQLTYADIDFILEAQVTECSGTQDYYFVWTVTGGGNNVNVSDVKGSRLVIRANTLTPGKSYDVLCQVYNYTNGDFITENSLPFRVLHRNLSVNFNVDLLVISAKIPFKLYTNIKKLESLKSHMTLTWLCTYGGDMCDVFYNTDNEGGLVFPSGIIYAGEYLITLEVLMRGQTMKAQVMIRATPREPGLPAISMEHMPRILNEGSVVTVKANVTKLVPGCSITWYFRSQHCLVSEFSSSAEICAENPHGTRISEPVNFYSLEKNFLSELTDYTNERSWKSVSARMDARAGRVRVVADCRCVTQDNCTGEGEVYADVLFQLNNKPQARYVRVNPTSGRAMETVYRLSTRTVADANRPLRYSFFVALKNNDSLLLDSNFEHTAIETLLPYMEGGTIVWVEVCDSLGACAVSYKALLPIAPGEARTVEALLENARVHVRRCEIMLLRRLAASAIVTYTNANQAEALSKFTTSLLNALGGIEERCVENNYDEYNEFMYWLNNTGIDTTKLM